MVRLSLEKVHVPFWGYFSILVGPCGVAAALQTFVLECEALPRVCTCSYRLCLRECCSLAPSTTCLSPDRKECSMSPGAWLVRGFGPERGAADSVCILVLLKDERL